MLVNVADIDTRTTLLGQTLATPVFLAPVGGFLGMCNAQGAIPVARASASEQSNSSLICLDSHSLRSSLVPRCDPHSRSPSGPYV